MRHAAAAYDAPEKHRRLQIRRRRRQIDHLLFRKPPRPPSRLSQTEKATSSKSTWPKQKKTALRGCTNSSPNISSPNTSQAHTSLLFDRSASTLQSKAPTSPSSGPWTSKRYLEPVQGTLKVDSGDFFFLFNQGLLRFYKGPKKSPTSSRKSSKSSPPTASRPPPPCSIKSSPSPPSAKTWKKTSTSSASKS